MNLISLIKILFGSCFRNKFRICLSVWRKYRCSDREKLLSLYLIKLLE